MNRGFAYFVIGAWKTPARSVGSAPSPSAGSSSSLVSLAIGLPMVHLIQPGVGLWLVAPPLDAASDVETAKVTLKDFVTHLAPASIVQAMARNDVVGNWPTPLAAAGTGFASHAYGKLT